MVKINERQKWPTDKARYDRNYEKIFGSTNFTPKILICKYCKGERCPACNWMGGFDNVKDGEKQR